MKKSLCLILFLMGTVGVSNAQSKDEKEVAATVERLNKAIIGADRGALEDMTAAELSYGHSSGKVENRAQFIERIASGSVDFLTIDISDQAIVLAGKSAIVRHVFAAKLVDEGKSLEIKIGIMMVWEKQNNKWKLLARQGYKL